MAPLTTEEIAARDERRRIEDALVALGTERESLERDLDINQQKIRALLQSAREVEISVRDIARMTGLSTQSLHAWIRELMRPIPAIHLGRIGPPPRDLVESVLRTMGEDPKREWTAYDLAPTIPPDWPNGSLREIHHALRFLARSLRVWQTDEGYRVAEPDAA